MLYILFQISVFLQDYFSKNGFLLYVITCILDEASNCLVQTELVSKNGNVDCKEAMITISYDGFLLMIDTEYEVTEHLGNISVKKIKSCIIKADEEATSIEITDTVFDELEYRLYLVLINHESFNYPIKLSDNLMRYNFNCDL